jgi:LemA protein
MNKGFSVLLVVVVLVLGLLGIISLILGAAYNDIVSLDEKVNSAWSQVENVYQRRMDLIPNLVETVKGYATHEKAVFTQVAEARSRAGSVQLGKDILENPEKFESFQKAQGELSSVLSRLMVVMEKYPELKADQNFIALQAQLEGTENRIAVERKNYNDVAQIYNTHIRQFPRILVARMFGFNSKQYFKMKEGADSAPQVNFK